MNRILTMVAALLLAAAAARAQQVPPERDGALTADQRRLSPDAIEMPASLRRLLGDVTDDGPWYQKGLIQLLNHVDGRTHLTEQQAEKLENPSFRKLLAAPDLYRGQAIRISFVPRLVDPIRPSPEYPADGKFWLLRGNVYREELKHDQPIMVVSSDDPGDLLGEPDRVNDDGSWVYEQRSSLRPVETVAVLFTIARGPGQDVTSGRDQPARRFAVMVTWQLSAAAGEVASPDYQLPVAVAGAVVMCLGLFYVARRYLKQVKQRRNTETPVQRYRRERQMQGRTPEEQDEDLPVNDELIEAANRYRQERGDE
jgi:hypothetical protein